MLSKKHKVEGDISVTDNPVTNAVALTFDRNDRSPLEFEGELLLEVDGKELPGFIEGEARYRLQVYRELHRAFVLKVMVIVDDSVIYQTAEFAESAEEVDELMCLLHADVMDGLTDSGKIDATEEEQVGKRLEAELGRLSLQVVERLALLNS